MHSFVYNYKYEICNNKSNNIMHNLLLLLLKNLAILRVSKRMVPYSKKNWILIVISLNLNIRTKELI